MSENYYIDINGNTIFRSEFYKNKGRCCKSSCLHCPYGHTLRTQGLSLKKINDDNSEELEIMALELERKSLLAEYRDLSKKVDLTFQKS
jgi:hypothetical protein